MGNLKLNGVIEEIKKRYPNMDISEFLHEKLQLPDYKADELATRIEKRILPKYDTRNRAEIR